MPDFTGQKALDYNTELRTGNIPGSSQIRLTASTSDLGGISREIWGGSTNYVFNYDNIGEEWEVFSSSANDTLGGSGAEKLSFITVLDDFTIVTEEVELNGGTVLLSGSNRLTLNDARVSQIGTKGGFPDGDIIIRKSGGGDERGIIPAGINIARDGILQVPAGFTWLFENAVPITSKGKDATFLLESTTGEDGIWIPRAIISVYQDVVSVPVSTINFEEKSLVRACGISSNEGTIGVVELVFTQRQNT